MDDPERQDGDSSLETTMREILAALARIEARLGTGSLANTQTPVGTATDDPEVQQLLLAGQKIAAIRLVRTRTGLGLAEAKSRVDALERRLLPAGRVRPASRVSFVPVALIIAAITIAVVDWLMWHASHAR
jgi:Ribosomal protein L7/L12 C-terminal domain